MLAPGSRPAILAVAIMACANDDVAAGDPSSAILERPSSADYECSVSQGLKDLKPRQWGYAGHAMAPASENEAWFARVEWMGTDPFEPGGSELLVSKIDGTGLLGSKTTIPVHDPTQVESPGLVALGDGACALIWTQGVEGNTHLEFAVVAADDRVALAPKTIIDGEDVEGMQAQSARAATGEIGIVWTAAADDSDDHGHMRGVFFVSVDRAGERSADPVRVATTTGHAQPVIAPAAEGGFALLWRGLVNAGTESSDAIFFARLDVAGSLERDPVQLSGRNKATFGASFGSDKLAILATGNGYVAAWTEGFVGDLETASQGYSSVRLLHIDSAGRQMAPVADLRPTEEHVDETEPSLVNVGDTVGVLWSRGKHVYGCGGCVPDHSLEFVLLDPATLNPVSNIVTVPPPAGGGLLRRSAAVVGSEIVTAIDISFHVHSEPGFAAYKCDKR